MPPPKDQAHRHSERAPRAPRKSKPKFEVPVEIVAPISAAEWVYRTQNVPMASAAPAPMPADEPPIPELLVAAGMGAFYAGAAAAGMMLLAAVSLVAAPVGAVKGFFLD